MIRDQSQIDMPRPTSGFPPEKAINEKNLSLDGIFDEEHKNFSGTFAIMENLLRYKIHIYEFYQILSLSQLIFFAKKSL